MATDNTQQALESLCNELDILERKLSIYDKALQFGKANSPSIAAVFEGWMEIVQVSGLPDFSSQEHKETVGNLRQSVLELFRMNSDQQEVQKSCAQQKLK
jgi:hypothetical protein